MLDEVNAFGKRKILTVRNGGTDMVKLRSFRFVAMIVARCKVACVRILGTKG